MSSQQSTYIVTSANFIYCIRFAQATTKRKTETNTMQLTELHIQRFEEEGYLVLENALKDFDLDPVVDEYEEYIDRLASQWLAEGKIGSLHDDEPFETRLVRLCEQNLERAAGANELLDLYRFRGKRTFEFLRNDNLLDLVEGLVGPEIICSPIQHLRAKMPTAMPPGSGGERHVAPWHQDAGVT